MKSRLTMVVLVALSFLLNPKAMAKDHGLGLGVILGYPTALSAKYYTSGQRALDFGLAYDFDDYLLIYGDYLHHFPGAFKSQEEFIRDLVPYVGVGPILVFDTGNDDIRRRRDRDYFDDEDGDVALGLRIPLGIEWIWDEFPLGVAVEIAPGIVIMPATDAFVQGGVAVRYYFD